MLIIDFHRQFTSGKERSRLFDALRRVSRIEGRPFLEEEPMGWPQWPMMAPQEVPRLEKA